MKLVSYNDKPYNVGTNPYSACYVEVQVETDHEARLFGGNVGDTIKIDYVKTRVSNGIPWPAGRTEEYEKLHEYLGMDPFDWCKKIEKDRKRNVGFKNAIEDAFLQNAAQWFELLIKYHIDELETYIYERFDGAKIYSAEYQVSEYQGEFKLAMFLNPNSYYHPVTFKMAFPGREITYSLAETKEPVSKDEFLKVLNELIERGYPWNWK